MAEFAGVDGNRVSYLERTFASTHRAGLCGIVRLLCGEVQLRWSRVRSSDQDTNGWKGIFRPIGP